MVRDARDAADARALVSGESPILRILIADDEPLALMRLRLLLLEHDDVRIAAEATDGAEALDAILAGGIDAVFLDVVMPRLDGFEVVAALRSEELPLIVFVTAHADNAVRAFDANAIDYLVKPFENDRFAIALDRLRRSRAAGELHARVADAAAASGRVVTRLVVRHRGAREIVSVADVDWIDARRNYARLHVRGQVRLLRSTLTALEQRLDPDTFLRVHRSALVNTSRIRRVEPFNDTEFRITLADGTAVTSSRAHRSRITAFLTKYSTGA